LARFVGLKADLPPALLRSINYEALHIRYAGSMYLTSKARRELHLPERTEKHGFATNPLAQYARKANPLPDFRPSQVPFGPEMIQNQIRSHFIRAGDT
jgi:hypothetical protein